jgi:hypothetical protein
MAELMYLAKQSQLYAGLPDDLFSNQKTVWVNFERVLQRKKIWSILMPFGIFYGHLVYFMAIWYILWPFGILFPVWYVVPRKIWQP